ncbi:hypothetical protein ANN_08280 [Periplaneta americana]|uniref:Uncharacterized protein n=1 Tax=Periplaneta americana TaxID=6978 RepID=A0ABQ8T0Z0_PERAM|nr:hypothetical protein ANN_08280 [Periplaneta americana]
MFTPLASPVTDCDDVTLLFVLLVRSGIDQANSRIILSTFKFSACDGNKLFTMWNQSSDDQVAIPKCNNISITILSPHNECGNVTDEDSCDENNPTIDNMPGSQLRAETEVTLNTQAEGMNDSDDESHNAHLNAIDLDRDRTRNLGHRRPALYQLANEVDFCYKIQTYRHLHHSVNISPFRHHSIAIPERQLVSYGGGWPRDEWGGLLETWVHSEPKAKAGNRISEDAARYATLLNTSSGDALTRRYFCLLASDNATSAFLDKEKPTLLKPTLR